MARLVLNVKQLTAEGVGPEQRLADLAPDGLTALSDGVGADAASFLQCFHRSVPRAFSVLFALATSCRYGLAVLTVASSINVDWHLAPPVRTTGTRADMVQHPWQHRIAVALVAGLLVGLLSAPVQAESQLPHHVTSVWQTEQAPSQNSVNAIFQDHRGYLWVDTFGGLVRLTGFDSANAPGFGSTRMAIDNTAGNSLSPPVVLEEAWANKSKLGRAGWTSVSPGNNTLDFRFTALSLSAPEEPHFKYRLERFDFDKDWVDAGTRRTANYPNTVPGEYSFHEAENYGNWNDQGGQRALFVPLPHFHRANWFYALCAVVFPAILWAAYQFRIRHVQRKLTQGQNLIETIPAMAWTALPDGSLDFINQRFLEFSGLSRDQGLGWGWEAAIHPEDRDHFLETWRAAIASGKPMEAEVRVRRADGQYRWLLIRNVPLRDETGRLVKWSGIGTDIDDRKRMEQALRQNEAYLAQAQNLAHTASWAWDPAAGEFNYWSEEMFRLFSFDPQLGLPAQAQWRQRIHPEDVDAFNESVDRLLHDKEDIDFEFRIVRPDGTVIHTHALAHPVLSAKGKLVELVGAIVDITERKRVEDALRQSEAYLAEAQHLSHTGSWAFDLVSDKYVYVSEECSRIFEVDAQQDWPTRNAVSRQVHPEDWDSVNRSFEKSVREKVDTSSEFRIVLSDGTTKHIQAIRHPVLNDAGRVVRIVGTVIDMTERKRAAEERERLRQLEEDLRHLNRLNMMGELAASLSHEMNQPITAVITSAKACLRWLDHEPPELERARTAAKRIENDGARAAETIRRVRDFYKKGGPPRPELLDVNEVAREMLELLRDEATKSSILMRTALAAELPRVRADRVQLQQVFMNLMLNGIEAMKETAGELTIKSQLSQDGKVLISVSDTGVGLPAERVDRLFSVFFTTKEQGTGMGLAICRSIIESHGGYLWASANSGRGATFHFTLPTR